MDSNSPFTDSNSPFMDSKRPLMRSNIPFMDSKIPLMQMKNACSVGAELERMTRYGNLRQVHG
jgi:hypothetical protein